MDRLMSAFFWVIPASVSEWYWRKRWIASFRREWMALHGLPERESVTTLPYSGFIVGKRTFELVEFDSSHHWPNYLQRLENGDCES